MMRCPKQGCPFAARASDLMRHLKAQKCIDTGVIVLFASCQIDSASGGRCVYLSELGGLVGGHNLASLATLATQTALHPDIQAKLDALPASKQLSQRGKAVIVAAEDGESTMQQVMQLQQMMEHSQAAHDMVLDSVQDELRKYQAELHQQRLEAARLRQALEDVCREQQEINTQQHERNCEQDITNAETTSCLKQTLEVLANAHQASHEVVQSMLKRETQ